MTLRNSKILNWIGLKLYGITLLVDIVDACPLRCPTCPVGVQELRGGKRMSIETFRQILDKLCSETKVRKVQLFRWSDPLLHPDLHLFIEECVGRGLRCSVSTALGAVNCDLEKVMLAGVDEFRVSFSGWEKRHIYQKGLRSDRFERRIEKIAWLPSHPDTRKMFFFHQYKDNLHEQATAKKYAEGLGFKFVAFPATFMVYDKVIAKNYTDFDLKTIALLTETPEQNVSRFRKPPSERDYCHMQAKELVLDATGEVQQCQMMYLATERRGKFLERPYSEFRGEILAWEGCKSCKKAGVPGYANCYADPVVVEKPVEKAQRGKYNQ